MTTDEKRVEAIEKAYGAGIIMQHSRWVRALEPAVPGGSRYDRICTECGEVICTGFNPSLAEVADHQFQKLLDAGLVWKESPATGEKYTP